MARFKIISKDGSTVRYEGKPKYNGSYLKPAYLEFSEIASDFPIAWEVGDYVDYSRTGMRYRLYSVPQPSKNARRGTHGKAFTYSSVQLFSATKELEIALFRDIVSADNNIHFSSSPDVATFEDVYGIARRIEACMNDLYPGRWEIRVADFDEERDAEVIEKVNTAKDFFMSGGTCLDALSKIYELWQDIGWFHTEENGKEIITIGYSNRRIDENTASGYLYGKGNGLRAIKKNQTNREEFATRLYVYGSERNIPSRYYNSQDILNAESVDIRNLMIPKGEWGLTDGKRDARKAYLENAEAVQKYGIIPKVHYFDSDEAGADIYPSIGGMTIGRIRKALDDIGQTDYYPSYDRYPDDAERVDEILSVENPQDDGMIYKNGKKYLSSYESITSEWSIKANTDVLVSSCVFDLSEEAGPCELSFSSDHKVTLPDKKYSVVSATITIETAPVVTRMPLAQKTVEGILENGVWHINLPDLRVKYGDVKLDTYSFYVFLYVEAGKEDASCAISPGKFSYGLTELKASEFKIRLKQIGFDISHQATIGKGCKVAVNTGACAGRDFVVTKCLSTSDGWELTAKRQQDDSLGYLFPNQDYQIAPGDRFVLIDIAMPDIYIKTAEDRLLSEGQKLLERASKIQNHYEPSIDAKVMHESGRSLREGMFMEITDEDVVDGATDYILIDTLGIYEDEDAIPTYKVTLKERRKVTYKGTPTAPSTESKSSSSDDSAGTQVDLSEYAKRVYVDDKIKAIAEELASMWTLDDEGNLVTERQVVIKNNLIIHGDMASGGEGEDTPVEGASEVVIDGMRYPAKDGVIDLTEAFANVEVDLSEYYTKNEVNELIDEVKAGDIDLANYYTKSEVDAKIPKKLSALENDLSLGSFAYKNALAVSDIPDLSGKYLPLSGGTIEGTSVAPLLINTSASDSSIVFRKNNVSKTQVGYNPSVGSFIYNYASGKSLGIKDDGTPHYYNNTLLHSGNANKADVPWTASNILFPIGTSATWNIHSYNAYKGITVLNAVQAKPEGAPDHYAVGLSVSGYYGFTLASLGGGDVLLYRRQNDSAWKTIAFTDSTVDKAKSVVDANGNALTLIHSGNVGDYNAGSADVLAKTYVNEDINNVARDVRLVAGHDGDWQAKGFPAQYVSGLSVMSSYVGWQLLSYGGDVENPYFRSYQDNGRWKPWRQLAFLDDNVASATKLATARTIWGQSFDGTGNVDGYMCMSGLDVLHLDDSNLWLNFGAADGGKSLRLCGNDVAIYYGKSSNFVRAMTINSSGNVGIGTITPEHKLDVNGSIGTSGEVFLNHNKSIRMKGSDDVSYNVLFKSGSDLIIGYDSPAIRFGRTKMFINSSGNVTIGSSDLAGTDAKLYVDGNARISGSILLNRTRDNADAFRIGNISNTNNLEISALGGSSAIVFKTNSTGSETEKMRIVGNGNVGIGTTNPQAKLHVSGGLRTYGDVFFFDSSGNNRITFTHASDIARIYNTGNSSTMYIGDYNGNALNIVLHNVGIGTTDPQYKLDVAGTGRFTGKVSASGGIDIPNGQQLAFLDASGNRHTIAWDSASNGILIDGNLIVLGELATGLPMQEIPSIPEIGV